jgi:hypothetical protein
VYYLTVAIIIFLRQQRARRTGHVFDARHFYFKIKECCSIQIHKGYDKKLVLARENFEFRISIKRILDVLIWKQAGVGRQPGAPSQQRPADSIT